jgi:hypothetical protein
VKLIELPVTNEPCTHASLEVLDDGAGGVSFRCECGAEWEQTA